MGPRDLLSLSTSARRYFLIGVGSAALASLGLLAWTYSLATAITAVVEQRSLRLPLIGFVLFLALRVIARLLSAHLLSKSSSLIQSKLRTRLVESWIDPGTHENGEIGQRSTLLGTGIDSLGGYLTAFLPARLLAGLVPVITLVVIGILDPWTLLILFFAGPMLLLLLAVIGGRTRTLADRRFRELGWLRSFYLDMVRGIPTLNVFNRADESVQTIEELSTRFGRTTMDVLRTAFQTSLVIEWAATAATALVAVQVSFRMIEGHISYSAALAVLMLTPEFFSPLRTLAIEYHAGQTGNAVLEQLSGLDSTTTHQQLRPQGPTVTPAIGRIVFDSIGFRYPTRDTQAVDDLNLTIEPGETVALIGPSGSGKSTVAKLLMGQVHPTRGQLSVNGVSLANYSTDEWLSLITSVPQDPFLFRASIRDNIAISKPDATESEIENALTLAHADEFVSALTKGKETLIGEDGATLSGGQRQRLAIARALLRPAPFVLLDEFTAHLDPHTESAVIASLRPVLATRTVLMIAHREATLTLADRVIELSLPKQEARVQ